MATSTLRHPAHQLDCGAGAGERDGLVVTWITTREVHDARIFDREVL